MLFLVLLVGLLVRLISLNQSLWIDEATNALVSKMSIADIFAKFLPNDVHPPLYYLILKYWVAVFGNSEISLRIPSVVFGIAAIYVTYLIAQKLVDTKAALISALLMSTSGLAIYYSQEARLYALTTLLVSLAVYLYLKEKWLWFSIILPIIGLTDYVSLFIIPVFFLAAPKNWRRLIVSLIPLITVFGLWSSVFIKQLSAGLHQQGSIWWDVMGNLSLKNMLLIPVKFILGRISFDNKIIYVSIVVFASALFGFLLIRAWKSVRILWLWLVAPVLLGIFASFVIPTLSYFRFIFCLPAFYILTAAGLERVGKYKYLLLSMVLAINILSASYYLIDPKFHREDWRSAASAIGSDKIVFPANSQKEALTYYGKGGQIIGVNDLTLADNEIWLSRYAQPIFDPADTVRKKVESMGYNRVAEYDFNGVVFWKYLKNQYARRN